MVNNFYVGILVHNKRLFVNTYREKLVFYTEDNYNYLDLLNGVWYTTCYNEKDYVEESSLVATDISGYKLDYDYMLCKHIENGLVKKKELSS